MREPSRSIRLPLTESSPGGPIRVTTLSAETIAKVVDEFYTNCRAEPTLGPIFARHVTNWPEHLARTRSFWSSALLKTGEYAGRPLEAHLAIPNLAPEHFTIWLRLFSQTVTKHCTPEDAAVFMGLSGRMAKVIIANAEIRKPRVSE